MNAPLLIPVILSGGAGTRLWPVSRRLHPKPFMRLPDGETLIGKTVQRALAVAGASAPVYTVTSRDHAFLTRDAYAEVAGFDAARQHFLFEPVARNTAPALLAAALDIAARFGDRAVMLVLPADHLIADLDAFARSVAKAQRLAAAGFLTTFGVPPTHPETGYGYIESGEALGADGFAIARFVEKPDAGRAAEYLASGRFYWNSGMFCLQVGSLLAAADAVCGELLAGLRDCLAATPAGTSRVLDGERFAALESISIDYAIMERASRRAVVPAAFDWSDIGAWTALSDLVAADADGNRTLGEHVLIATERTYVQGGRRLITTVGVSDLLIVDTEDALLIAHREQAQAVKQVVDTLRARGHAASELHATVQRPWGSYTVLEDAPDCKVKRLIVKPGQVLSLQLHHRRSEHWTVVKGTAKVRIGDEEMLVERNQSVYIPMHTLHRLENPTDQDIALIETQCGDYFGEDDIERLEDRYGRC
ncbi:MAG: mannose-1-phosphate guanylyltransferase/mannose-6-phosphate isomerase [Lysobacterales bacterium]